ncbi:glycosyl transferase family 25 [Phyllobacterium ifriqiyense]|uniref:Glycosyl transferase family 25 n=1 Tax=Phyllobacterium ifriqiyense TaxID=314238 RepID=A0ABU0S4G7_9HYPH|nr:glycosyltransferase family 25 protein [Phyllobacterium ifriqiyense]MDQ0995391.1 glycosyl transferase family 25 [Phyllobacterium ifriqiyense]
MVIDEVTNIGVYVLSLKNSTQRRETITAMFSKMGYRHWEFFEPLTADRLPIAYEADVAFRARRSVLSPGEVSCAASHIAMLQQFLDSNLQNILIMEDDVQFDPFFNIHGLAEVMNKLELHYLKLYARYFVPSRYISSIGRYTFYRGSWPLLGTQAYVLSRIGATQLLQHLMSLGALNRPIDDLIDRFWCTRLPITFIYPFPVMELGYSTTIHGSANRDTIARENLNLEKLVTRRQKLDFAVSNISEKLRRRSSDRKFKAFDRALMQRIQGKEKTISRCLDLG